MHTTYVPVEDEILILTALAPYQLHDHSLTLPLTSNNRLFLRELCTHHPRNAGTKTGPPYPKY